MVRVVLVGLVALVAFGSPAVGQPTGQPTGQPQSVAEPPPIINKAKLTPKERERIRKACEREEPACDQVALLGSLEKQALDRALVDRGFEIDPAPWGKVIGQIHVYNNKVFSKKDGFLQFFNNFHRTTREYVIDRESILQVGDVWDQDKVQETSRRLRDPVFSSLAVAMPVRSAEPGKVDVLIVTRDVWSLRFNTEYQYQDNRLTYLTFSLSENNFLGLRKLLSFAYEMDLSEAGIGPVYYDTNVLGKHVDFYTRIYGLFNRDDLWGQQKWTYEGSQSVVRVNRPLWNLAAKWGGGVEFRHLFAIERRYQQDAEGHIGLRTYDDPDTADVEAVPYEYKVRSFSLSTGMIRGFGDTVKHRLKAGHQLTSAHYRVADDFGFPMPLQTAFERDVLPRSEVTSALYLGYEVFVPHYREYRNVGGFDLAEDVRLGPSADSTVSFGMEVLGSDTNFIRFQHGASYVFPWGTDGVFRVGGSLSARLQAGESGGHYFIDNTAALETRVVTPTLFRWLRVVNEIRFATLWHETQNRFLSIGGDNGLRGFGINQFDGQRRVVMQTEIRTAPIPIKFTRWGIVAFHDIGGASETLKTMTLHNDVGLGIRLLLPQMSAQVMRFDFAFPLDGNAGGQFRFTAGFNSAF
jgi:hypothetical protein